MKRIRWNWSSMLLIAGAGIILVAIYMFLKPMYIQKRLIYSYDAKVEYHGDEALTQHLEDPYEDEYYSRSTALRKISIKPEAKSETEPETKPEVNPEPSKNKDYKKAIMVIDIPSLDVRAAVVEGTTLKHLKYGPGLFEISPFPDAEGGNVCVAAHRDRWFRHIDTLKNGDKIILEFNGGVYEYSVEKVFVVGKKDWSITEPTGYSALTLVTCISVTSDSHRIIVRAKRV